MRRLFIYILLTCVMVGTTFAENHFVYLRYDPKAGSPKPIVEVVENLFAQRARNQVLVFLSTNDRSLLARTELEWLDIRGELYTMQSTPEFYAHNDISLLTQIFTETFSPKVDGAMHLRGSNDNQWTCHFIVPQEMFVSEDMESILQLISLNELPSRLSVTVQTYDAGSELHFIQALPNGKFTNYGFTVQRADEYARPVEDTTITEEEVLPEEYDFSAYDAKLGTAYVAENEEEEVSSKKSKKVKKEKKSKKGSEEESQEQGLEPIELISLDDEEVMDVEENVDEEPVEGSVLPDDESLTEEDGKKGKKVKKEKTPKAEKSPKAKKEKKGKKDNVEDEQLTMEDTDEDAF